MLVIRQIVGFDVIYGVVSLAGVAIVVIITIEPVHLIIVIVGHKAQASPSLLLIPLHSTRNFNHIVITHTVIGTDPNPINYQLPIIIIVCTIISIFIVLSAIVKYAIFYRTIIIRVVMVIMIVVVGDSCRIIIALLLI